MKIQDLFPLFAGVWLAIAMIVVLIEVIGGYRNERKENDKKLGK